MSVVRDEADVIGHSVRHLLDQGVDEVLVADSGSVDGTSDVLRELGRQTNQVHLALDRQRAHRQSEKMTWLAHLAWRHGADWIVPFDADEFWFAEGRSVAEYLRSIESAGIVHAEFLHMVPTEAAPQDLMGSVFVMDTSPSQPGKVAARSHPFLFIGPGNHYAARVGGEVGGLHIAHAQYRGPAQIARKVRQGTAAAQLTGEDLSWFSPHWAAGARLDDREIEDVWRRISRGLPEPRIGFAAAGPMATLSPLTWSTWDPDGQIASARDGGADAHR